MSLDFRPTQENIINFDYYPFSPIASQDITFGAEKSIISGSQIVNYAWTMGDGNTKNGPIVKHAYASPGTYLVTLTLTDSSSNTYNYSQSVTVQATENTDGFELVARAPSLNGDIRSGQTFRTLNYPETISFSMIATGLAASLPKNTVWDFGDGNLGYGESVEYTYLQPGTFTVTATTKNKFGSNIVKTAIIEVSYGRQCYNDNNLNTCLFLETNNKNVLSLAEDYWTLSVSDSLIASTPGPSWLFLEYTKGGDIQTIDISDAGTLDSGKIKISKSKVLAKNLDFNQKVRIFLNNKDSSGVILRAKSDDLYFGDSTLKVVSDENNMAFEIVNTKNQYRRSVKLSSGYDFTLNHLPPGTYALVSYHEGQQYVETFDLKYGKQTLVNATHTAMEWRKNKGREKKLDYSDNLPSWSNSLCGEPAPFSGAVKKSQSTNQIFTHQFTSYNPDEASEFAAISPTMPRPVTLNCGVTNPALLYSLYKWKYKDGTRRCGMGEKPHPKWNEYQNELESNSRPIIIQYKIRDAWSSETISGHYVTSVTDLLRSYHIELEDLTSYVGIPKDADDDWSLRFKKILPVPAHFRRPEISFYIESDHNSSSENFYSVECSLESSDVKPMVSRLQTMDPGNITVHHRDFNSRITLEKQYGFFPVHFDGRSSSAHVANNESTKARYAVDINYGYYLGVLWQGVKIKFKYDDQEIENFYPFISGQTDSRLEKRYRGNILIDTSILGTTFKWVQGIKNIEMIVYPVGKISADYDFTGMPRTYTFKALFDLQTVRSEYTSLCSNSVFSATRSMFVTDELLTDLLVMANNDIAVRCSDASTPFGGPFRVTGTWRYSGNRYGNAMNARTLFTAGEQDAYDNFTSGSDLRKQDVAEYMNFSGLAKTISEISTEEVFDGASYADSDRKKILNFCNPVSGDALLPCTESTTFAQIDLDKILKICQWYSTTSTTPAGCPAVNYSRLQRFSKWVDFNARALYTLINVAAIDFYYSNGVHSYPAGLTANFNWQELAIVNGIWPDGYPIWKYSSDEQALVNERILSCHEDKKGCSPLRKYFGDDDRHFSIMKIQVPWR